MHIGTKAELNFAKNGDHWDNAIVDKVAEMLHEYKELFPMELSNLKGIIGDFGVMKITLNLDAKPMKERPY